MNKFIFSSALIVALLAVSCTPKVGRSISKTYAPLPLNEPVEIYLDRESVPSGAEQLGTVKISDSGFTNKCDSASVVEHIKNEARQIGGNAAVITKHTRPSFWGSTCHQMEASLLNISDFSAPPSLDAQMAESTSKAPRLLPSMKIAANFGYGWRTAKTIDTDAAMKDYINDLKSGPVWDASFNYYFNDSYGLGLLYNAYSANANAMASRDINYDGVIDGYGNLNTKDNITFIGPAFLIRLSQNQTWIFNMSVGIGYIGYTSKATFLNETIKTTGATVGFQAGVGVEYKFSKNWGIGADLSSISGLLNQVTLNENGRKSTIKLPEDQREGLGNIRLSMGVRYYIK